MKMLRFLALYAATFGISFVGVAAIKVAVVGIVLIFRGGHYEWQWGDLRDVLKQGAFMALVLCAFVTVVFVKNRK